MNLFKQVPAFSRGRYAAHLFTNGIHGEEMGNGRASLLLSPRRAPHAARTHSYDEQER
jgi:hypothetical protein